MVASKGRLLKVGAAAILSVGILAACGEYGGDDIIIDDSNEGEVNPNPIRKFEMSQTTLEDLFMKVVKT